MCKMNGIKQVIILFKEGLPICWKTYGKEIEAPSEMVSLLMAGFFSAITSFSQQLSEHGQNCILERLVVSGRTLFVKQNEFLICVLEADDETWIEEAWGKIYEQYQELQEHFPELKKLLQLQEEFRQDFGLLIDTIMTSLATTTRVPQLITGRNWLSRFRR